MRTTPILSHDQALEYFREAAKRNDALFLSYSGQNADEARKISEALNEKFQNVFDYKARERPIPGGSQWVEEIYKQIAARPLGVILLSPAYLESGHCEHEMVEMIAKQDSGGMKVVPIKLQDVDAPPALRATQYLRAWDYRDARSLVEALIRDIDRIAGGKS